MGYKPLQPNKQYTLSFYAKGSGSGTYAYIDWYVSGPPFVIHKEKLITNMNWPTSPITFTETAPSNVIFARITFLAESGKYLYVSSTSFG